MKAVSGFKLKEAFPNMNSHPYDWRVDKYEPNRVWWTVRNTATHTGPLKFFGATYKPTGKVSHNYALATCDHEDNNPAGDGGKGPCVMCCARAESYQGDIMAGSMLAACFAPVVDCHGYITSACNLPYGEL